MKVKDLKVFIVGNPPPSWGGRYFIFVKLTTDNGITGIGECYCDTFGPKAMTAMIEDTFYRYIEGMDPFHLESMWRKVYGSGFSMRPDISLMGVLSGLEIALWDIKGKAVGKPVVIEDDAWIFPNVLIMPGVTVGRGAVVWDIDTFPEGLSTEEVTLRWAERLTAVEARADAITGLERV